MRERDRRRSRRRRRRTKTIAVQWYFTTGRVARKTQTRCLKTKRVKLIRVQRSVNVGQTKLHGQRELIPGRFEFIQDDQEMISLIKSNNNTATTKDDEK